MRHAPAALGATLLFVAAIGCAVPVDFGGPPFLDVKPEADDLPGLYLPLHHTVERITEAGYAPRKASIEIRANGTLQIENMPDWWGGKGYSPRNGLRLVSGAGQWQIKEDGQGTWGLDVVFPSMDAPGARGSGKEILLRGGHPPYLLHLRYGDSDQGEFMLFQKVTSDSKPDP